MISVIFQIVASKVCVLDEDRIIDFLEPSFDDVLGLITFCSVLNSVSKETEIIFVFIKVLMFGASVSISDNPFSSSQIITKNKPIKYIGVKVYNVLLYNY